jgi:hypothetical protein
MEVAESFDLEEYNHILSLFPKLRGESHVLWSPATRQYNCIAFAGGDYLQRWGPERFCYWPRRLGRSHGLRSYRALFVTEGYADCERRDLEPDVEKIALYVVNGSDEVLHAARQRDDGMWLSKLGDLADIEHVSLGALEGDSEQYGQVALIMSRRRPTS